ncbi:MAG: hypothetical protein K9J06_06525 [Flavobacteriales bacterium]|nr:hypothetical protein [Flavobacteriales bacterium]
MRQLTLSFFGLCLWGMAMAQVKPLPQGHAHNDYWHLRPLHQALEQGFMSVEADIHLLKGDLLVNHETAFTRKGRTLERLYLQPLYELAKANGFRSIFPDGPQEFVLYIDIKQGCPHICDTLISQLKKYEEMLTVWDKGQKRTGAVSIIIGACGREEEWLASPRRWFYFEGNFNALGGPYDSDIIPRLSGSLRGQTRWRGRGQMDGQEQSRLRNTIAAAHAEGRTVRFWAATNRPKVWKILLDEGADIINVDRLRRFKRFMAHRTAE